MADTTPEKVRLIADHLQQVDDPTIQMFIDDAKTELSDQNIKERYTEKLQRYLAAHLATLNHRRLQSQSVDGLSKTYASSSASGGSELDSTEYGQEFQRIMRKATGLRLVVL